MCYVCAVLIAVEECKEYRHDDEVADSQAKVEQHRAQGKGSTDCLLLIFIQSRSDELPDEEEQEREGNYQRTDEAHLDMGEELR